MFHVEDVLDLRDHEEVVAFIRRHPLSIAAPLLGAAGCIVIPFLFLFSLMRHGMSGFLVLAVSVTIGVAFAVWTVTRWQRTVCVITTERVVNVEPRGIMSSVVTDISRPTIARVHWERVGMWGALFGMGKMEIQTSGTTPDIELRDIAHLEDVQALLRTDAKPREEPQEVPEEETSTERPSEESINTTLSPRVKDLVDLMDGLPPEAIDRIEAFVQDVFREHAARGARDENTTA